MSAFSKMMLVPAQGVPDPTSSKISSLDSAMHNALVQKKPTEYLRPQSSAMRQIEEAVETATHSDYNTAHVESQGEIRNETDMNNRITAITHQPQIVNFNPSGELVYHGVTVPNTNILDLIAGQGEGQQVFDRGVQEAMEAYTAPKTSHSPSTVPKFRRQQRLNPYSRKAPQTKVVINAQRRLNDSDWQSKQIRGMEKTQQQLPTDPRNTLVKTVDTNERQSINYLDETVEDFLPPRTSTPRPDHRNWETLKDTTGETLAALRRLRHLQNKRKALRQTGPSRKYARDIDDPAEIAMVDRFMRLQRKRRARTQIGPSRKYMREPHDLAERRDNLKHK